MFISTVLTIKCTSSPIVPRSCVYCHCITELVHVHVIHPFVTFIPKSSINSHHYSATLSSWSAFLTNISGTLFYNILVIAQPIDLQFPNHFNGHVPLCTYNRNIPFISLFETSQQKTSEYEDLFYWEGRLLNHDNSMNETGDGVPPSVLGSVNLSFTDAITVLIYNCTTFHFIELIK